MDRRTFLKEVAVFSTALSTPTFFLRSAEALGGSNHRSLVVIELVGGSDGLNTVIPYRNPDYYAARPNLAIPAKNVLKMTDTFGFHPALTPLRELYDRGHVAIVQGVGYPNPRRCHVRSRSIWQTGCLAPSKGQNGWLDCRVNNADPDRPFGAALRQVARAIRADSPASLFHVRMEGFDTHTNQVETGNPVRGVHADLLARLASKIEAFWDEVRALGKENEVLVMTFSEFGRRVRENASAGTDHGTANQMFFFGAAVKPGFHGEHPGLAKEETDLVGDMVHTVDFRSVYSTVLARWLGVDPIAILGERFTLLDFV